MRKARIAKTTRRVIAGCSLALLIAAGGGAALAHGGGHKGGGHVGDGGDHVGNGGHGRCIDCGGSRWTSGGNWARGDERRHHHHDYHHRLPTAGNPPLHGPGSTHNPIIYHPVHGPGSSHNPIIAPMTVVRDHRRPPPHHHGPNPRCNSRNISGCEVRDHRTPPAPQCLGDLC
jgi:hypothetical protein